MADMPRELYRANVTPGAKALASLLWSFVRAGDPTPFVWPSISRLSDYLGQQERSTKRQLGQLRDAGLISRHSRNVGGKVMFGWRLLIPLGVTETSPKGDRDVTMGGDRDVTMGGDRDVTLGVTETSPKGDRDVTMGGDRDVTLGVTETSPKGDRDVTMGGDRDVTLGVTETSPKGDRDVTMGGDRDVTLGVTEMSPGGDRDVTLGVTEMSPRTTIEATTEPTNESLTHARARESLIPGRIDPSRSYTAQQAEIVCSKRWGQVGARGPEVRQAAPFRGQELLDALGTKGKSWAYALQVIRSMRESPSEPQARARASPAVGYHPGSTEFSQGDQAI